MLFDVDQRIVISEDSSSKYKPRTIFNAKNSTLTVAFAADFSTGGEILTKRAAGENFVAVDILQDTIEESADKIVCFLNGKNDIVLNIAGNGIRNLIRFNIDQDLINLFVLKTIEFAVKQGVQIQMIRSGGQTGADIAGARAGFYLGIPVEIRMPKGRIQRFQDGIDREMSVSEIINDQIKT